MPRPYTRLQNREQSLGTVCNCNDPLTHLLHFLLYSSEKKEKSEICIFNDSTCLKNTFFRFHALFQILILSISK